MINVSCPRAPLWFCPRESWFLFTFTYYVGNDDQWWFLYTCTLIIFVHVNTDFFSREPIVSAHFFNGVKRRSSTDQKLRGELSCFLHCQILTSAIHRVPLYDANHDNDRCAMQLWREFSTCWCFCCVAGGIYSSVLLLTKIWSNFQKMTAYLSCNIFAVV